MTAQPILTPEPAATLDLLPRWLAPFEPADTGHPKARTLGKDLHGGPGWAHWHDTPENTRWVVKRIPKTAVVSRHPWHVDTLLSCSGNPLSCGFAGYLHNGRFTEVSQKGAAA